MSRKEKGKSEKLDLGLSDLLRDPAAEVCLAPQTEAAPLIEGEAAATDAPELNGFEKLAASSSWQELAALSESSMAAGDAARDEAGLWWVLAQLRLKALPLSMLCAPLDAASEKIFKLKSEGGLADGPGQKLCELSSRLIMEVAGKLADGETRASARAMLERAWRMSGSGKEMLTRVIRNELADLDHSLRISQNSGEMLVADQLRSLLAELGEVSAAPAESASSVRKRSWLSDPQHVLIVILLLMAAALFWYFLSQQGYLPADTESSERAEFDFAAPVRNAGLLVPSISLRNAPGSLDALNYELESRAPLQKKAAESAPSPESSSAAPPTAAPQFPSPAARETIDTSGPLRPADFPSEVARPTGGQTGGGQYAGADLRDNGAARPVEVESFSDLQEYTVRFRTQVMSKPSDFATPMHELKKGDMVKADARVGLWLRLRSREGRPGYVREADLEELR